MGPIIRAQWLYGLPAYAGDAAMHATHSRLRNLESPMAPPVKRFTMTDPDDVGLVFKKTADHVFTQRPGLRHFFNAEVPFESDTCWQT